MLANTPIGPDSGYLSDMFFLNVSAPQIVGYMPMTTLPAQCRPAQDGIGSQFTAFQVILADCSDPYPVCISDDSPTPLLLALRNVAQIPQSLRRLVRTFIFGKAMEVPANDDILLALTGSSSSGAVSLFRGYVTKTYDVVALGRVWSSEMQTLASANAVHSMSSTDAWKTAVDADACIASKFGQASYLNAAAEAGLVTVFKRANGIWPNDLDLGSCMANQLFQIEKNPNFGKALFSGSCAIPEIPDAFNTKAPAKQLASTVYMGVNEESRRPGDGFPPMTSWLLTALPSAATTEASVSSSSSSVVTQPISLTVSKGQSHPSRLSSLDVVKSLSTTASGGKVSDTATRTADIASTSHSSKLPKTSLASTSTQPPSLAAAAITSKAYAATTYHLITGAGVLTNLLQSGACLNVPSTLHMSLIGLACTVGALLFT